MYSQLKLLILYILECLVSICLLHDVMIVVFLLRLQPVNQLIKFASDPIMMTKCSGLFDPLYCI